MDSSVAIVELQLLEIVIPQSSFKLKCDSVSTPVIRVERISVLTRVATCHCHVVFCHQDLPRLVTTSPADGACSIEWSCDDIHVWLIHVPMLVTSGRME